MPLFSERNGYVQKPLLFEEISAGLKNRIWNFYNNGITIEDDNYVGDTNYLEEIMDSLGLVYYPVQSSVDLKNNRIVLHNWFQCAKWYQIYDFIELYLQYTLPNFKKSEREYINNLLTEENAGYRVDRYNRVVPLTNKDELLCVERAQNTAYKNVNKHFGKATELFSRRPNPDYENSIKESICAVEAMCCVITGQSGKQATLGKTIKQLKEYGVVIHPAMENAFSSLYGYTSDEDGIRHGGIDFSDAPFEDAKYMLVSCSAFVNYLIDKWNRIQ